jgi:peptidoglycan DL-endopeptidase CwlO
MQGIKGRQPIEKAHVHNQNQNRRTKTISALIALVMLLAPAAYADSFDAQISALNSQIAGSQQAAQAAHAQADTVAGQIDELDAQIASVTAQLQLNRTKQVQTQQRINDAQAQLATKKAILDEEVRAIYQDSQVTPLEMLASSNNFSDYVDKQQYNDQIKDHIQDELAQVNQLKADLEGQQAALNVQVSQEAGLSSTLQQQKNQQAQLLAAAQGNEAQANADVKAKNGQVASLRAQQSAAIQAASSHVSRGSVPGASGGSGGACDNGSGNGGYPMVWCNAAQDSLVDNWGMYNRECVSYAAWKRSAIGRPVPGGWGNANQWPGSARAAGYSVDGSPRVGDVAVYMGGFYGHVGVVEAVNGGSIIMSDMNGDNAGHFSYDSWPTSSLTFIH